MLRKLLRLKLLSVEDILALEHITLYHCCQQAFSQITQIQHPHFSYSPSPPSRVSKDASGSEST